MSSWCLLWLGLTLIFEDSLQNLLVDCLFNPCIPLKEGHIFFEHFIVKHIGVERADDIHVRTAQLY